MGFLLGPVATLVSLLGVLFGSWGQLKDASQLAGLELGRNGAGVPAAAERR